MREYTLMKKEMQVKNGSVEKIQLPKDYKEVIKQYIWNAIEAGATQINLNYERLHVEEDLPGLKTFAISDNGTGIIYDDIESTFGAFLDSQKKSRLTKGGKGKGRLSFMTVANKAVWSTVYQDGDKHNLKYQITIKSDDAKDYEVTDPLETKEQTGTTVEFLLLKDNFDYIDLESSEFAEFIALEFGWYQGIFERNHVQIKLNGEVLDFSEFVQDKESFQKSVTNDDGSKTYDFLVEYIGWNDKIGTESRFYFIGNESGYAGQTPTGFNKEGGRAYGFVHSLYIRSHYFDNFELTTNTSDNVVLRLSNIKLDQNDEVYKNLVRELKSFLEKKKRDFLRNESETIIDKFVHNKTIPNFPDGPIGAKEREDFDAVVKGVFNAAPTLLTGLKREHEQSMLGFIQLVLRSDERDQILDIVGNVIELDPIERKELSELLKHAKLSGVIKLLNTLKSRYSVVELLNILVFKNTKTTTERGQLQKAIEQNCWLFGEEYNLIGADKTFAVLEEAYNNHIDSLSIPEGEKSDRRPDVFIARSKNLSTGVTGSSNHKLNLIIELKRPSVTIDTEQYRQVEDYRNILRRTPAYNSALREWHLYIVGVKLSEDIIKRRESMTRENRPFLVNNEENYYIYAMTWAEVFDSFDIRHDYLLEDLGFDKGAILQDLNIDVNELTSAEASKLIKQVTPKKAVLK